MKKLFLRITSVVLVLLLLFAASGCKIDGQTPEQTQKRAYEVSYDAIYQLYLDNPQSTMILKGEEILSQIPLAEIGDVRKSKTDNPSVVEVIEGDSAVAMVKDALKDKIFHLKPVSEYQPIPEWGVGVRMDVYQMQLPIFMFSLIVWENGMIHFIDQDENCFVTTYVFIVCD